MGLLDSAINMPKVSFGGDYLHKDVFEMAAIYAYCIIKNHPFADGNKRTGIVCALLFLNYNSTEINVTQAEVFD